MTPATTFSSVPAPAVPSPTTTSSEPVVVGLVGSGYWAAEMHAPLHAGDGPTRLAGIWGADPEQTAALAARHGVRAFTRFEELLDACEAVDFAVPPSAQAALVIQAARAGKGVLCEKPLADTVDGARKVVWAVEEAGVANAVVLTKRYHERTRAFLHDAAALRASGPVLGATGQYLHGGLLGDGFVAQSDSWRNHPLGILRDLGPHLLDLADLAAGPIVAVRGEQSSSPYSALTTWHADGGIGQFALSAHVRLDAVRTVLDVFSAQGTVSYTTAGMDHAEIWPAVRAEFAAAVRTGAPVTVDVRRALWVNELLGAVETSLAEGRRVDVAHLDG